MHTIQPLNEYAELYDELYEEYLHWHVNSGMPTVLLQPLAEVP